MSFAKTLTRDEMKNVKAGIVDEVCTCQHNGCFASLREYSGGGWRLDVACGGDDATYTAESGSYGGTVCGGEC